MEASALHAPPRVARISLSAPLLRLRSDEQLIALFRGGNEDAFSVMHDRYRPRIFAYARQMLSGSRQDAEDAVQDVFVRAYGALRADDRPVVLRAWLYRVAHNRCIDAMRRPTPAPADVFDVQRGPVQDPLAVAERREDLRQLVHDVRALPSQQRSALLMRELEGLSYDELAGALGTTVPAVKSLLVRARVGLAATAEARDADCADIRADLALAHGRGVRATGRAWRHVRECPDCREFRQELRSVEKRFAALAPVALTGPLALLAKLTGSASGGGATAGSGAAGSAAAGGSAAAAGTGAAGPAVAAAGSAAASGSAAAGSAAAGSGAVGALAGGAAGTGAVAAGGAAAGGTAVVSSTSILGGASILTAGKVAAVVASVVVTGAAGVAVERRLDTGAPPPAPLAAPAEPLSAPPEPQPHDTPAIDVGTASPAYPAPADPVQASGGTVAAQGTEPSLPVEATGGLAAPSEPTVAVPAGEGPPPPPDATEPDPQATPAEPSSDPAAGQPVASPGSAVPGESTPAQPAP